MEGTFESTLFGGRAVELIEDHALHKGTRTRVRVRVRVRVKF